MTIDINTLMRPNIRQLKSYSSARSEFAGKAAIFLDANENAFGRKSLNRYPDPLQEELKKKLSEIKNVSSDQLFIGNGSDEIIDLLIRAFCVPGKDKIIICPPTYGMYEVCANINDVTVTKVLLKANTFDLDTGNILEAVDKDTKIIFICNPNNPTGNRFNDSAIETLLGNFRGLVVVDEAYIDFSNAAGYVPKLDRFNNLVILQTLSKAWGAASLRIGMGFASKEIISVLTKIKPPYNINNASQQRALEVLDRNEQVRKNINTLCEERKKLSTSLKNFSFATAVYKSETNFILVKTKKAQKAYQYLTGQGIVIRNRSTEPLCEECLRITVGTKDENNKLIKALKKFEKEYL